MIDINNCRYRTSVKGIIRNEQGDILLCQEANGKRELPGWGLEHEESVFTSLRREIKEEMGLEVVEIEPRPLYYLAKKNENFENNTKNPFLANVCYAITVKNLDFIPSDECIAIWFFNPETVKSIDAYNSAALIIEEIFASSV